MSKEDLDNSEAAHEPQLYGAAAGQSIFAGFIDHNETHGRHIIRRFAQQLSSVNDFVDLGAGYGADIRTVTECHPYARAIAIDSGDRPGNIALDIERDRLPFLDETQDLIIANQILEHCKEIFWIMHEITRVLRVGGSLILGVPNVASLHNRLLLLTGRHPTQHKLASAHVRPFSKQDTIKFFDACCPGGYHLDQFAGAQFYPLPRSLARAACGLWPNASFSIFFLLRKTRAYTDDSFKTYPVRAGLETNFWAG